MFLQEIGVRKIPLVISEDNERAIIFLAKNQQVGVCTKHIHVKYHFIRDIRKDEYLEIVCIYSEDNNED